MMQPAPAPEITDPFEAACWIVTLLTALSLCASASVVFGLHACQGVACGAGFFLLGVVLGLVAFMLLYLSVYGDQPPRSVRLGRI